MIDLLRQDIRQEILRLRSFNKNYNPQNNREEITFVHISLRKEQLKYFQATEITDLQTDSFVKKVADGRK